MTDTIAISPTTKSTLNELAARTGQQPADLLDSAVEEFRIRHSVSPIATIPGVNPAAVWEAAAEADAGILTPHTELFSRLRSRG